MNPTPWSDDQVNRLKKLLELGCTAEQASVALGVSRNAVIGKAHRMKIRLNGRKPFTDLAPEVKVATRLKRVPDMQLKLSKATKLTAPRPMRDHEGKHYTVETVPRLACRWPYGAMVEGNFHFCGHEPVKDTSWCPFHANLVYTPGHGPRGTGFELRR